MVTPYFADAELALSRRGHSIPDAPAHVLDRPGVYAIHAGAQTWIELGLAGDASAGPLYVGRALDSLVKRDLRDHFALGTSGKHAHGNSGKSTVRRSFAALLRTPLDLHGRPRGMKVNPSPSDTTNYGLEPDAEKRLTDWMHASLTFSTWALPLECSIDDVVAIEKKIVPTWAPPLNISMVATPNPLVKGGRAFMSNEARRWASSR